MKTVLFLCTGNSCRSQMVEAIVQARYPEWRAYAAGRRVQHGFADPARAEGTLEQRKQALRQVRSEMLEVIPKLLTSEEGGKKKDPLRSAR